MRNCDNCGTEIEKNEDFGNREINLCVKCAGNNLVENYPDVLKQLKEHVPEGQGSTTVHYKTRLLGVDMDGYAVYYQERRPNRILWVCPMNSHKHDRHDNVIEKNLKYNKSESPGGPAVTPRESYLTMKDDNDHIQITSFEDVSFGKSYPDLANWMEKQEWAALSEFGKRIMN